MDVIWIPTLTLLFLVNNIFLEILKKNIRNIFSKKFHNFCLKNFFHYLWTLKSSSFSDKSSRYNRGTFKTLHAVWFYLGPSYIYDFLSSLPLVMPYNDSKQSSKTLNIFKHIFVKIIFSNFYGIFSKKWWIFYFFIIL